MHLTAIESRDIFHAEAKNNVLHAEDIKKILSQVIKNLIESDSRQFFHFPPTNDLLQWKTRVKT